MIKFFTCAKTICYVLTFIMLICIIGSAGAVDLDEIGIGQFILQVIGFISAGVSFALIGWVCDIAACNLQYKYIAKQRKLRKQTSLNRY